ncbi:hypothetical protein LCGC14_1584840 [marine sediment metagenome]|uniref:VRR-NUC domain-containing protein n=1 Tax=marine sediment metagenome TaxID=412755 RepID=A0A0F9IFS0_9ZZZZ
MHRAARRDKNEAEIIEALRRHGYSVDQVDSDGTPDLLVGFAGINLLMEVKSKSGKLTKPQVKWHEHWGGQKAIIRSVDEALNVAEGYFNA